MSTLDSIDSHADLKDLGEMRGQLVRKLLFRWRLHYLPLGMSAIRRVYWRALGMQVGAGTRMASVRVTWPHKIALGERCTIEHGVSFNCVGPYTEGVSVWIEDECFVGSGCEFNVASKVTIGRSSLVGSGTRFIDHDHGVALGRPMKLQKEQGGEIRIGADVWIGANCVLLKGVTVGDGAIVAAGSVVTRPVEAFSLVAGVPARFVRQRG